MEVREADGIFQFPEGCLDAPAEMIHLLELLYREMLPVQGCDKRLPFPGIKLEPYDAELHQISILMEPCDNFVILALRAFSRKPFHKTLPYCLLVLVRLPCRDDEGSVEVAFGIRKIPDFAHEVASCPDDVIRQRVLANRRNQIKRAIGTVHDEYAPGIIIKVPYEMPCRVYLILLRTGLDDCVAECRVGYIEKRIHMELVEAPSRDAVAPLLEICIGILVIGDIHIRAVDGIALVSVVSFRIVDACAPVEFMKYSAEGLMLQLSPLLYECRLRNEAGDVRIVVEYVVKLLMKGIALHRDKRLYKGC